ncbi:MAG: M14 family zinc carboxypeptidase, partial [Parafilimonas sp.]
MKKILLLLACITLYSVVNAQPPKYYRVKIFTDDRGLAQLALKGLAIDHGEYKKGAYFIGEFSQAELNTIKKSSYRYEILISDMSAYYAARSKKETVPLENPVLTCSYPTPVNFKLGSMGGFYTYTEMLNILDSMRKKYPNLISIKKPVSAITTGGGNLLYYVRISNNPNIEQNKPKLLYTALHHAREPESLTQLIFFMWYLLENYATDADVQTIINSDELYFIPCVNPDGYLYNQQTNPNGGGLWRKNRRNNGNGTYGVDLNRNYGYKWGYDNYGSSPYTLDETYRGPSAFSEPETQIVADFCTAYHFIGALNNHTYSNVFIYPYGYKPKTYTKDSALYAREARRLTQCNHFFTGTVYEALGYLANGDSDDWMYGEQTTKPKIFAATPETGSYLDGFWPAPNRIIPLSAGNLEMNLDAAKDIATLAFNEFAKINSSGYSEQVIANKNPLLIYPNPSKGKFIVTINENANMQSVKISDRFGKIIFNNSL